MEQVNDLTMELDLEILQPMGRSVLAPITVNGIKEGTNHQLWGAGDASSNFVDFGTGLGGEFLAIQSNQPSGNLYPRNYPSLRNVYCQDPTVPFSTQQSTTSNALHTYQQSTLNYTAALLYYFETYVYQQNGISARDQKQMGQALTWLGLREQSELWRETNVGGIPVDRLVSVPVTNQLVRDTFLNHIVAAVQWARTYADGMNATALIFQAESSQNLIVIDYEVTRGDITFVKEEEDSFRRLAKVPFLLTNVDTGEKHVLVTDDSGRFSSHVSFYEQGRENCINANDALLNFDSNGLMIPTEEIILPSSIWFAMNEYCSESKIASDVGALPIGRYHLRELHAETNDGYHLIEVEFVVHVDDLKTEQIIDLGTIYNKKIAIPEPAFMRSHARLFQEDFDEQEHIWFDENGIKVGAATTDVYLHDVIETSGLKQDELYYISGILINKEESERFGYPVPLLIDGHEVTADTYFIPTRSEEVVVVSFHFDASSLANQTINVFERLYHVTSGSVERVELRKEQLQVGVSIDILKERGDMEQYGHYYELLFADEDIYNDRQTVTFVEEKPEVPEVPGVPEVPEEPELPEIPEIPKEPEEPEIPEVPEELEVPEEPESTEVPSEPERDPNQERSGRIRKQKEAPKTGDTMGTIVVFTGLSLLMVMIVLYLLKHNLD